jgi:tetratricopeptide (TPR) repeat protein
MRENDKALENFQAAYDKDPRQISLVKTIAGILIDQNKHEKALDLVNRLSLQDSHKNSSTQAFFENLKAEIFLKEKNLKKAQVHLEKAIKIEPDYITPHNHLAKILTTHKDKSKALEQFKIVEDLNPRYIPALMAIGSILDFQGNYDRAATYYRKVLRLNPNHPNAANNLAFILAEKKGGLNEGFRLATIARKARPDDPDILDTMGWLYFQKGIYLSARSELEESLRINPESALANFHYAMILYQMREYEKARRFFEKALKINSEFKGADIARKLLN